MGSDIFAKFSAYIKNPRKEANISESWGGGCGAGVCHGWGGALAWQHILPRDRVLTVLPASLYGRQKGEGCPVPHRANSPMGRQGESRCWRGAWGDAAGISWEQGRWPGCSCAPPV